MQSDCSDSPIHEIGWILYLSRVQAKYNKFILRLANIDLVIHNSKVFSSGLCKHKYSRCKLLPDSTRQLTLTEEPVSYRLKIKGLKRLLHITTLDKRISLKRQFLIIQWTFV